MAITNASRLADFGTGIGTEGAVIDIDNANAQVGLGTTNPNSTVRSSINIITFIMFSKTFQTLFVINY